MKLESRNVWFVDLCGRRELLPYRLVVPIHRHHFLLMRPSCIKVSIGRSPGHKVHNHFLSLIRVGLSLIQARLGLIRVGPGLIHVGPGLKLLFEILGNLPIET